MERDDKRLDSVDAALAADLLEDGFSGDEITQMLKDVGGNPEDIGRRGARKALERIVAQILTRPPAADESGKPPYPQKALFGPVFAGRITTELEPTEMSDEELEALVKALMERKG